MLGLVQGLVVLVMEMVKEGKVVVVVVVTMVVEMMVGVTVILDVHDVLSKQAGTPLAVEYRKLINQAVQLKEGLRAF